jgi:hypothetical protein
VTFKADKHFNYNLLSIMENQIRNVTLAFPCREDWDKFEMVLGGRLCASCHHIVRDFRDCTMSELRDAMNDRHVCGKFRMDQLTRTFAKAGMAVAAITTFTACGPKKIDLVRGPAPFEIKGVVMGIPIRIDTVKSRGVIIVKDNGEEKLIR